MRRGEGYRSASAFGYFSILDTRGRRESFATAKFPDRIGKRGGEMTTISSRVASDAIRFYEGLAMSLFSDMVPSACSSEQAPSREKTNRSSHWGRQT